MASSLSANLIKAAMLLAGTVSLGACATMDESGPGLTGGGTLRTSAGIPAGTVQLVRGGSGSMSVNVAVLGLPAGTHGVHLHTTGTCTVPDFTSAGGHLNPGAHQHGTENPAGSHLGDLPNLVVRSDGTGTMSAVLRGASADLQSALFDADGTALVVHASADDYRTDPTGSSGGRIACAVLTRN